MTQFYSGMKGPVAIDKLNELWDAAGVVISGAANTAVDAANAAVSAAAAAGSASTASTQATNAAGSASTAVTSANSAQASATNASTSASNSATSATAAAASASSIAAAAALANTKAGEAATSASTAAGQATTAAGSATAAAGQASSASTSATTATTQAQAAGTSATNAAASATTATTQATNAATSATTATTQAANALTSANQASIFEAAALSSKLSASASEAISVAAANSASSSATLAENWASKIDGTVNGIEYSAKYWANLAAGAATGSVELTGGITGSGVLGVPISTTLSTQDKIDFNTAGTATDQVARVKWNEGDGTLEVGLKGGNVTLQIGQEQVQRILNNTGSTLVNGTVVYAAGAQGQRLTVAVASNTTESTSSKTIGVLTENITNGAEGFITTEGLVRNINTSSFAEGSILWLGTSGSFTSTKPVPPAHAVMVGFCVRQHASSGSIFVRVQNGQELYELHDVLIDTLANNDLLVYETASGLWKNKTLAMAGIAQQTALALKANSEQPTFTGTVSGITAAMVGLGNVNNTSDVSKPVSIATQTALDLKANSEQPTFTGNTTVKVVKFASQFSIISAAYVTANFANGQKQLLTLTAATTVAFSFPGVGNYQLILTQDATGNRTVTWTGVTRYVGSATAPAINIAANTSTIVSIYYDGTNVWLAAQKVNA